MRITVKILPGNTTKSIDLKPGAKVLDVLKEFQLKPDTIIAVRNNTPIPVDDVIKDGQELKIIKVASGG